MNDASRLWAIGHGNIRHARTALHRHRGRLPRNRGGYRLAVPPMKALSELLVAALAVTVLVAVVLLLPGCIVAPPPPYCHEYRYPAYHDWRLY
jgi:hypothetical protein